MKKLILLALVTAALIFADCSGRYESNTVSANYYNRLDSLIEHKQFFAARDILQQNKTQLSEIHFLQVAAALDNVFNRLDSSVDKIELLFKKHNSRLTDSLRYRLLGIQQSNYAKLYDYKKALDCVNELVSKYSGLMNQKESDDYRNTRIIWQCLSGQPKQQINIKETVFIKMSRDKAGLANLPVSNGEDSLGFIFDTGANISTTTASTATRMGMQLLDSLIDVTSITGKKIKSRLAVCKDLYIHSIHVSNVVFLVFPDSALYIPQIDFQINGIIGFPVINAMGEVHISKNDEFLVPLEPTADAEKNMALDFLTPVIGIDGESYTFDTGADETMLYAPYYKKYAAAIDSIYRLQDLKFGGAGGSVMKKGYKVNFERLINGRKVQLDSIHLFEEQIRESVNDYYGNIGQDLIGKFDKMILNFKDMFVKFE